jgi:negative regulator of flagellin synthesis FlgM
MKVTNQGRQNTDVSSLKSKNSTGVDGLENLGKQNKNITNGEKIDAAKVALSDRAQDLKKIKELAVGAPEVNAEKVKKFQALIDSGQYKVDSKKVADKMVDDHLMMAMGDEE